jgi:membrane associated rhomboid family serine protease
MMTITPVVKQLLILNILFYIGSQLVPNTYEYFSLYYPGNDNFRAWQPITHMFMHAPMPNITHILFNMFGLYSFGSALEHFWGGKKFIFFYISCGLGAALMHLGVTYLELNAMMENISNLNLSSEELNTVFNSNFRELFSSNGQMVVGEVKTILERANCSQEQFNELQKISMEYQSTAVGASGALYGLMTAFAFMFPNAELALMFIPVPIKAKYFVPGILAIDLFFGLKGSSIFGANSTGIAHFAHIGGALFGFIMMWYWKKNKFDNNRWD